MDIFFNIVAALSGTAIIICVGIYIYQTGCNESDLFYQLRDSKALTLTNRVISYGAYIGFALCLYQGTLKCLTWLPDYWGGIDDSGDFVSLESSLAVLLASFAFFYLCGKINNLCLYRIVSLLQVEDTNYQKEITGPFSTPESLRILRVKIMEKHKIQRDEIDEKMPRSNGRYQYVAQEKELIYRRLLKKIDDRTESEA